MHAIMQTTDKIDIFDHIDMDFVVWDAEEEIPLYIKWLKNYLDSLAPNKQQVQEIFNLLKTNY